MERPNLAIIKAHRSQMQAIHDFLEFMEVQGYTLTKNVVEDTDRGRVSYSDGIPSSGQKLDRQLAEFFEFDYDEAERERQAIIDSLG